MGPARKRIEFYIERIAKEKMELIKKFGKDNYRYVSLGSFITDFGHYSRDHKGEWQIKDRAYKFRRKF